MSTTVKKLLAIGDLESGKTALLHSLIGYRNDQYQPTVFDSISVQVVFENEKTVDLELHDSSGQERFYLFLSLLYPHMDVLMLCYDVHRPDTLVSLEERWLPEIASYCSRVPLLVIGTKKGVVGETPRCSAGKTVPTAEGQRLAKAIGAYGFFEYSFVAAENAEEILKCAASAIPVEDEGHQCRLDCLATNPDTSQKRCIVM